MAEKNTESTAVNQLIELVATAKPLPPDPDEDLMFRPVDKGSKKVSGARTTRSVPAVSGAGDVEPLPRARAPIGTQQGLQTLKQIPPGVRISTAPPSRAASIPPLTLDDQSHGRDDDDAEVTNPGPATFGRPTSPGFAARRSTPPAPPTPTARATGSNAARLSGVHGVPVEPIASRTTRPTLPPPAPTIRASAPPVPGALPAHRPSAQPTSSFSYPVVPAPAVPQYQPASMPAIAPDHLDDDPIASILEPTKSVGRRASVSWLEHDIGTQQVPKKNDWKVIAGKLIGPMVVLVIVGIFIGGYFAFDGDGGKQRAPEAAAGQMPVGGDEAKPDEAKLATAPNAPAAEPQSNANATETVTTSNVETVAPAPVTPPNLLATAAEPAKPERAKTEPVKPEAVKSEPANIEPAKVAPPSTGRPTLVDVRIDSNPSGATVILIDRGKQSFLGTTPMSAAVDLSRKYELVFSYDGRATVVESLDPTTQKKLSVKLSRAKSSAPVAAPTPAVAAPKVAAKPVAPKPAAKPASGVDAVLARPATAKPAAALAGEGTLMISSKPPCEILIDGKSTGLTTPQRAITLAAGAHKITLVNTAEGIKKTVSVQITADKPTKVIQDFMK